MTGDQLSCNRKQAEEKKNSLAQSDSITAVIIEYWQDWLALTYLSNAALYLHIFFLENNSGLTCNLWLVIKIYSYMLCSP